MNTQKFTSVLKMDGTEVESMTMCPTIFTVNTGIIRRQERAYKRKIELFQLTRQERIDREMDEAYDRHVICLRAVDLDTDKGRQTIASVIQPNENTTWNLPGPRGVFYNERQIPPAFYTIVDRLSMETDRE